MTANRVGIAGAGIAGLTTALSLARRGIASTVVERAPQLSEVGAGLQISPNAGRILESLDLTEGLDRAAVMPEAIDMRSGRTGEPIVSLPLGESARRAYGAPYRLLHRADLQSILLEAVQADPRIELRLGAEATAVRQTHENVTLSVGDETLDFDAMIVADGVRSKLKQAVDGALPSRPSGRTAWRSTIPVGVAPRDLPHERTTVLLCRDAHVVIYPLRGARLINIIVVIEEDWGDDTWSGPGAAEVLRQRFDQDSTRYISRLTKLDLQWTRWCLAEVEPSGVWVEGRVALIGDAAHAMLPFLAQGAAMAIEDADVLARELSNGPVADALQRYQALRRPRVMRVWKTARQAGQIYHLGGPMAVARDLTMTALGGERLLQRYDWIYGWQSS
ncbi:FAD-dependent monooxygenase [Kaistia defluvii]|uniref:FAD-dependent monooxygenase n=1 Tax=Kaistia defluvii TaxID=410841 RepID=UPI002253F660|nr:FAD-dependent monooxygenase [Kaistia defluvii]MCX5521103.1 FAD-dependent monooxygenase [Kaistia defluvii]